MAGLACSGADGVLIVPCAVVTCAEWLGSVRSRTMGQAAWAENGAPKGLNSERRVAHFPAGQTDDQAEAMWHICGVGDILGLPLTLSSGFPEQTRLVWARHVFQHPNWPSPFPQGSHKAGNPGPLHKASWLLGSLEVNRLGAGGGHRGSASPLGIPHRHDCHGHSL